MFFNITEITTGINWDLTATLITGIATFLGTIVIYFTLIEIQKQRKNAYQPTLVIPSRFSITFKWDNLNNNNAVDFKCYRSENSIKNSYNPNEKLRLQLIKIQLFNIGMGPAKDVNIFWNFNDVFFKETLKEYETAGIIVYDKQFTQFNGEKITKCINNDYAYSEILDYVLPISIKPDQTFIRLPSLYLEFFALFCKKTINFDPSTGMTPSNDKIPKLELTIKYDDIAQDAFTKKFLIKGSWGGFSFGQDSILTEVSVFFKVEQI
jgi:hypothetical protein